MTEFKTIDENNQNRKKFDEIITKHLNDGWEIVNCVPIPGRYIAFFKK